MAYIKAISYYLPERVVTNDELLTEFPEWSVDKVAKKVGVNSRHIADEQETAGDLAEKAALKLENKALKVEAALRGSDASDVLKDIKKSAKKAKRKATVKCAGKAAKVAAKGGVAVAGVALKAGSGAAKKIGSGVAKHRARRKAKKEAA